MDVIAELAARRVVPVLVADDVAAARGAVDALVAGGLPVVEITFRTDAAEGAIGAAAARGDVTVGAGTVLTPDQVDRAVGAGAAFVVSPGLSRAVAERCHDHGVAYLPGAVTATEVQAVLDLGLTSVKFFPAATSGGVAAISALAGPFPGLRFVPTGGIGLDDLVTYLQHPAVLAVGGSWMVPREAVRSGDLDRVREMTARSVKLVGGTL